MAASVNQQLADAFTERQLLAGRVETRERQEVWALLLLLERDLLDVLKMADPFALEQLARRRREVERMVQEDMAPLVTARYAQIAAQVDTVLVRLAQAEARATQQIINETTGEATVEAVPPAGVVRTAVTQSLFPSPAQPTDLSTTGADWWTRQGAGLVQRLGDQLLVSAALGETVTQAVAKVQGTGEAGYQDGLMGKARADAARLLSTQVTNALGEARVAMGLWNAEQVILQHQALLESRNVCLICFVRHGKRYTADPEHTPIGHTLPYLTGVPYHPLCRCAMLTVLPAGGAITDDTLATWLRRKGPAYQQDVLGPTRARMFREGTLGSPRHLLNALTGRPLTLEELES